MGDLAKRRSAPVGNGPYASLKSVADALDLPRHYRTDLTTHDRAYCEGRGMYRPFLWALYDCGTHVVELGPGMGAARYVTMYERTFDGLRWYLWNGTTLYELVNGRRAESVADDYEEVQS